MSACVVSVVRLLALDIAHFMGFSRQEYRVGLPFPPPGILPTRNQSLLCILYWQLAHQPHLGSPIRIISYIKVSFFFTGQQAFSGTTVGLAYLSEMCSPDFSAGVIMVCLKIKLLVLQFKSVKGCCAESMEKILFSPLIC